MTTTQSPRPAIFTGTDGAYGMAGFPHALSVACVGAEVYGTTDPCTAIDAAQGIAEREGWITLGCTALECLDGDMWEVQHYAMPADTDPVIVREAIAYGESINLW